MGWIGIASHENTKKLFARRTGVAFFERLGAQDRCLPHGPNLLIRRKV